MGRTARRDALGRSFRALRWSGVVPIAASRGRSSLGTTIASEAVAAAAKTAGIGAGARAAVTARSNAIRADAAAP